jgi:spermidine/putrescine-binding protein
VASGYIEGNLNPINETDKRVYKKAEDNVLKVVEKVNVFYKNTWAEYRGMMEKISLSPFKEYEAIRK